MSALQIFITGPALKYEFVIGNVTLTQETDSFLAMKLNISFLCTLYGTEVILIFILSWYKIYRE